MAPFPPALSRAQTEIAALCSRYGVKRLELFGSAALISLFLVPNVSQILGQTQVLTGLAGTIVFLVGVSLMAFALAGIVRSTAGAITNSTSAITEARPRLKPP